MSHFEELQQVHESGVTYDDLVARIQALEKGHDPLEIQELIKDFNHLSEVEKSCLRSQIKSKTGYAVNVLKSLAQGDNIDQLGLAKKIVEDIGRDNILSTTSHIWMWKSKGIWEAIHKKELQKIVQNSLYDMNHRITRGLVDAVSEVLDREIFSNDHEWNKDTNVINFTNGEAHLVDGEWVLKPHNREAYRTSQLPHEYLPEADCPRFKQFLEEIFANDPDKDDKAKLLAELMGYSLMSHAEDEAFCILIGSGANGKSVVLSLIEEIVGPRNVAAVQPNKFNNAFQRAHLHNKLVNLVTEITEGSKIADGELKAIVSGELSTAEHKNRDPFDFKPYATCWFGTNHMPHTRDLSDGLFRRAYILTFNNKFTGTKADPKLRAKLAEETPGIISMVMKAYAERVQRRVFTIPESCKDAKSLWRKEADQAAMFVEDVCETGSDYGITSSFLYSSYSRWAEQEGIKRTLSRRNFTNRLKTLGFEPSKGTNGIRTIQGLRLIPNPLFDEEEKLESCATDATIDKTKDKTKLMEMFQ